MSWDLLKIRKPYKITSLIAQTLHYDCKTLEVKGNHICRTSAAVDAETKIMCSIMSPQRGAADLHHADRYWLWLTVRHRQLLSQHEGPTTAALIKRVRYEGERRREFSIISWISKSSPQQVRIIDYPANIRHNLNTACWFVCDFRLIQFSSVCCRLSHSADEENQPNKPHYCFLHFPLFSSVSYY